MEYQNIRQLAQMMRELELTALEFKEGECSIRMARAPGGRAGTADSPLPEQAGQQAPQAPETDVCTVTAPMVGVFYASPAPDMRPYVSVGDTVRAGDVLCVIEAMKMMNEITAETGGVVTEICAGNKQVVDYGHPLFRLRPAAQAAGTPGEEHPA